MEVCRDFKELFELFNERGVEHVIVGGYAPAHHGAPRYTRDIDLYIRPTQANAERVVAVLDAFGFGQTGLMAEDFAKPGQVIQLGVPPVRIDLVTSSPGCGLAQACGEVPAPAARPSAFPYLGHLPSRVAWMWSLVSTVTAARVGPT